MILKKLKICMQQVIQVRLMGKKAVMGALLFTLDFINLFIMLLRLFGQRR